MPELPEVEVVCQALQQHIAGHKIKQVIVRRSNLRWPIPNNLPSLLCNQTIINIKRRSKYILIEFNKGILIIHLGMSGHIRLLSPPLPAADRHDHFDFILSNHIILRYCDPRRFGSLLWTQTAIDQHPLLSHIGVEPLTPSFNARYLYKKIHHRRSNIKTFIMNHHIVAGVGNIYANEALFLAGIHPTRLGHSLLLEECHQLCKAIKKVLKKAIAAGGTTLNDFYHSDGKPGYFFQKLCVYGRVGKPCVNCHQPIMSMMMNQRNTFFCNHCQT